LFSFTTYRGQSCKSRKEITTGETPFFNGCKKLLAPINRDTTDKRSFGSTLSEPRPLGRGVEGLTSLQRFMEKAKWEEIEKIETRKEV
jgi:hypothetical protein